MNHIWKTINEWRKEGREFALARVMDTWSSAPRKKGAAMIVDSEGNFSGSVSGGCVESAVVREALEVIEEGIPRTLEYGIDNHVAWEVGLSCGGKLTVCVEAFGRDGEENRLDKLWPLADKMKEEKTDFALVHRFTEEGADALLIDGKGGIFGETEADLNELQTKIPEWLAKRFCGLAKFGEEDFFVHTFPKPNDLIVIGAGHISIELVQLCRPFGFTAFVIDPRKSFADLNRFPVAPDHLMNVWPEEILPKMDLHPNTYAALLTHDPKIDDPAFEILLSKPIKYIGALGSKKTHAKRVERLLALKIPQQNIDRIRAPIGLSFNAQSPAEIALSILAQIIQTKNEDIPR